METKKHNIENFEKFLREKTDEFRMYPSKRVWYSIYNDMHPGNRLPSVSMTVVLIGFLFLVGYLNTTESAKNINAAKQDNQNAIELAVAPNPVSEKNISNYSIAGVSDELTAGKAVHNSGNTKESIAKATQSNNSSGLNDHSIKRAAIIASTKTTRGKAIITISNSIATDVANTGNTGTGMVNDVAIATSGESSTAAVIQLTERSSLDRPSTEKLLAFNEQLNGTEESNEEKLMLEKTGTTAAIGLQPAEQVTASVVSSLVKDEKEATATTAGSTTTDKPATTAALTNKNQVTISDKAWIDDFALHNKPAAKKWAGKLGVQAYITPSVVYRKIRNNAIEKQLAGTNSNFNNFNADDVVKHKPSFGIETGLSLQYDISRRIRIKAGAQFNYTRYNAFAYETNHPVAATLTMNADDNIMTYEVFRTSNYTNIYGNYSTKLHNETFQFSLPVGADYKVASISDKVSWYAGATLQPTLLLFARSFVLSTDRRSYVQDPSLLNRFNMNAGFETYFSFNKSGYTLQLGPQYRTQLFSTNTKVYSLEERLQNFGFKMGITKRL